MAGAFKLQTGVARDPAYNRAYLAEVFISYSLAVLFLYVAWTVCAPALIGSDEGFLRGIAATNYIVNYYMCHQMPERSFSLFGNPMPLCERCLAIFAGSLIAYAAAAYRRRLPRFLSSFAFVILSLVPIGIDGVTQLFGMRESNSSERVATGLLAGFAVLYYLVSTLREHYTTNKPFLRLGIILPTVLLVSALLLPVLAASAVVGSAYAGPPDVAPPSRVFYIPPHAATTISVDEYASSYSDPVLTDVDAHWQEFGRHTLGVWVAVRLDAPGGQGAPQSGERFTYISSADGRGEFEYTDAWTGESFLNTTHRRA